MGGESQIMRREIIVIVTLGLMITATFSFFETHAETVVPTLSVGDQWSYGWFNGEFTGEVGGHKMTVTVDRMEDIEGVPCYVCIYEHQPDAYENHTQTVWITSDWVILKHEIYDVLPGVETIITFTWNPGMKMYDFPLTVGKEWADRSYRTIEQTIWEFGNEETGTATDYIDWSRKVVSTETVAVPAGTFETHAVEGFGADALVGGWQRHYFSPDAKNHVKMEGTGEGGGGHVLTSYDLVPKDNSSSNLYLAIPLATSIGILGFTYLLYNRRNRDKWGT